MRLNELRQYNIKVQSDL